jgi:tetratricopeptide (TPR) repeat protein
MGVAGLFDDVWAAVVFALAPLSVWFDARLLAVPAGVCVVLLTATVVRARRRQRERAGASRLEWRVQDLKEMLRQRLAEQREPFVDGAAAAPMLGASAVFEADIEAAARSVMVEAGGRRAKAKHLLRKHLNGNGLNGTEAAYWRQLGALSLLDSTRDAVRAYARAADLAPDDPQAQMLAGVLYLRDGRLDAAEAAFRRQSELAGKEAAGATIRYRASTMLGDALLAKGEHARALEAYREAQHEAATMAGSEPDDAERQRDLSLTHDRIGDLLLAGGDVNGALKNYRASLVVAQVLSKRDPARSEWQRDLSVTHDRIGEAFERKGDMESALASYREGLKIAKALARRYRDRADLQWDVSLSLDRIGDVLVADGEFAEALASYRQGLEIAEAVAESDPRSIARQRELAASYHKAGTLEAQIGNDAEAVELLERGRAIIAYLDRIAERRAQWRSDLRKFDQALETMRP